MNPDFNSVVDSTDSTLLSSILIGSLRFVMRPTFVPVSCRAGVIVHVVIFIHWLATFCCPLSLLDCCR